MECSPENYGFTFEPSTKHFLPTNNPGRPLKELTPEERAKARYLAQLQSLHFLRAHRIPCDTKKKINLSEPADKEFFGRKSVFGVKLKKLLESDRKIYSKLSIPLVVNLLFDSFKHHQDGFTADGVLRKSANANVVKEIKTLMATDFFGKMDKISGLLRQNPIHVTAAILKFFIRCLPGTLFTSNIVEPFARIGEIPDIEDRFLVAKLLVLELPVVNAEVFYGLLKIFDKIRKNSSQNQMDTKTIVLIMAANLFEVNHANDQKPPFNGLAMMIENYKLLFTLPPYLEKQMKGYKDLPGKNVMKIKTALMRGFGKIR